MRTLILAAVTAALVWAGPAALAQCGGDSCRVPGPEVTAPPGTNKGPDDDGWYWNVEGAYRWRWVDKATGKPLEARRTAPPAEQNYGVDRAKLDASKQRFYRRGREISRDQALSLVTGKDIPDDANRLRLTVIGDEAARREVIMDLATHPALTGWADKLTVQSYEPSHWAVSGFSAGPGTTVYLQLPDGTVLHRQGDYQDGAEGLAAALRKADPYYDPYRDPDMRRPDVRPDGGASPIDLSKVPTVAWAIGAFGLFMALKKEEK
jgi:hypothetical protein